MAPTRSALGRMLAAALATGLGACSERSSAVPTPSIQTISKFSLIETQNGVIQWTLQAREATMRDAGGAETVDPRVELYENGKPATAVRSKQGRYDDATRNIHMENDVVVVSRDPDSSPTTLKTESLDYINAKQIFKTDFPVIVERAGSVTRGRGLIANHDLSEIHVLHQESEIR